MTHELATITFHGTALLAVRGETPAETLGGDEAGGRGDGAGLVDPAQKNR